MTQAERQDDAAFLRRAIEVSIQIGLLVLIFAWCFEIVRPFITLIVWASIIATALHPVHRRLAAWLGGRGTLAAALIASGGLAALLAPTLMLAQTTLDGVRVLSAELVAGTLKIPPAPESVGAWPVVGEPIAGLWNLASVNLEAALRQLEPQLTALGAWLFAAAAGAGLGALQFLLSIALAGVLLARAQGTGAALEAVAVRIAGERGREFVNLAAATVRSVAQGVLGVALIQAILAQIGLVVIGVPAAGLWALLVLILAIAQLPTIVVLGPIVVYVFTANDTLPATLFAIWAVIVSVSDTFLKPLLLGRGVEVPVLVILVGAIGGLMMSGILGLFVGAVVLTLGYELIMAWVREESRPPAS